MKRYKWLFSALVMMFFLACGNIGDIATSSALAAPEKGVVAAGPGIVASEKVRGDTKGKLRFMGRAEPWESYSVVLLPGESIEHVDVKKGEEVRVGDPLLHLVNDQLANSIGELSRRKNEAIYNMRQSSLLDLEIELKEKYLAKIDKEIAKEEQLVKQIVGYSSQLAKQLQQQRSQLADQLILLRAKNKITKEMNSKNQELNSYLQSQIDKLVERRDRLSIKAPFAGKIFHIAEDPLRAVPGRPVCELWNDSVIMIRGSVMQHQYSFVQPGAKVKISMEFSGEKKLDGVVYSIEQGMNMAMSRGGDPRLMGEHIVFSVLIRVDDPQWLKPGMMVSVEMVSSLQLN